MMCRGLVVIPKAAVERRSVTLPKNTLYTSKAARRDGGVQFPLTGIRTQAASTRKGRN